MQDLATYNKNAVAIAKKYFAITDIDDYYKKTDAKPLIFCHFARGLAEKVYNEVSDYQILYKTLMEVSCDISLIHNNQHPYGMQLNTGCRHTSALLRCQAVGCIKRDASSRCLPPIAGAVVDNLLCSSQQKAAYSSFTRCRLSRPANIYLYRQTNAVQRPLCR